MFALLVNSPYSSLWYFLYTKSKSILIYVKIYVVHITFCFLLFCCCLLYTDSTWPLGPAASATADLSARPLLPWLSSRPGRFCHGWPLRRAALPLLTSPKENPSLWYVSTYFYVDWGAIFWTEEPLFWTEEPLLLKRSGLRSHFYLGDWTEEQFYTYVFSVKS
jgi:hypothetical protein